MKKFLALAMSLALCLLGCACGGTENSGGGGNGGGNGGGSTPPPDISGYELVTVNQNANPYKLEGLGAQMDQCIFSGAYTANDAGDPNFTAADLEIWKERLRYMKIDVTRVAVVPDWWEAKNDNDNPDVFDWNSANVTFDGKRISYLYKVLDLCKEFGIKVNFSFYGIYPNNFNAAKNPVYPAGWLTSPESYEEFAETVYAALYYMTEERDYGDIITEFSLYPEPDTTFVKTGEFRKMCEAVIAKLEKEGIRDRFVFSGPAEISDYGIFEEVVETMGDLFDKFSGSMYKFNNTTTNFVIQEGTKPFADLAATLGKTYGTSEFGSNLHLGAANQEDIDTYDRALYLARMVSLSLSSGFTYHNYWVLGDCRYDAVIMELGLWKYKTDNWALRPQFYSYSLMTRYTEPGSDVFGCDLDYTSENGLSFVALRTAEGKWTYIVTNNSDETRKVAFKNPNFTSGTIAKYELTRGSMPTGSNYEIASSGNYEVNAYLKANLKARSVTVFTQL